MSDIIFGKMYEVG